MFLQNMKVGDNLTVKGPKGQFIYSSQLSTHLSMIAGGTGISPMYQVIKAAMQDEKDTTTISLLYANVTEDDIRESFVL
jgi:cytochrome-b5 reductase